MKPEDCLQWRYLHLTLLPPEDKKKREPGYLVAKRAVQGHAAECSADWMLYDQHYSKIV